MIINENEKNRIKSLYGLLTESAPPEESILVANKNPFKYTDLNSARRQYSPNLKDGDLFFVLKKDATNYIEGIFTPLYLSFSNKTIRISNTDDILKIKSKYDNLYRSTYISINQENKIVSNVTFTYSIGEEVLRDPSGSVSIGYQKIKVLDEPQDFTVTCNSTGQDLSITIKKYLSRIPSNELQQRFPEIYNALTQIGEKMKETYKSRYVTIIDQIPNEYFEIRKIERQKTDF